ncbi:PTS system mannose/fructose/sorbose family transporter subunit IID [Lactobacillus sp. ESL0785]|uniref:PTS system mannose/fructose/sorbose family transporter subunit IID n=1 Tax=Lactobacillus sp. ESL0785 TaxID=2983232 RepID=UPI0023F65DB8|nr:PTS system mannose/fructose/sorbose family transporter subunit IID [Lactobacillus sp. ESL0785]WEV70918.1 PTS system mannose/fructose/sorbose family transporter subunit IID [Lactobacillus sp. ESL0785]
MSNETNDQTVLTKKDLRRASWRWIRVGISSFNYQTQLAPSVAYAMLPSLRKIYKGKDEDLRLSLDNEYKYFNTNPWIAPLIFGATLAMEDKDGVETLDGVQSLKVGLMGPLAGIGDTIIWAMLPTIFGSIGASLAKQGNPFGIYLWVIFNLIVLFFIRSREFEIGYKQGMKFLSTYSDKLSIFTEAISVLGLTVIGALIPSTVSFTTPLKMVNAGVTLKVQDILDKILPSMLPMLLVGLFYWLIKKKNWKMTTVIWLTIAIAMVAAFFNVLTV